MAEQQQPGLLANILAVAGFIILILIIVWGAYHLLRLAGSGFSGFFSGADAIEVTAPNAPVDSGRAFPLSWQYEPAEDGTYALLYQCEEGLRLDVRTPAGSAITVPCGNAYSIGTITSLSLVPTLVASSTRDVPLSIIFIPSATSSSERPQGDATISIRPAAAAAPAAPAAPTQPAATAPSTPQKPAGGTADLSVRVLAVGVIDPMSGVFIERAPGPNDTAAVQFDIANVGSAASGSYTFSVQLPTQPVYPYISAPQASLTPGSHVVSTLRFGPVAPGGGTIAIEVDAKRATRDANRANNTAAVWMNAQSYPYFYQAPFVY